MNYTIDKTMIIIMVYCGCVLTDMFHRITVLLTKKAFLNYYQSTTEQPTRLVDEFRNTRINNHRFIYSKNTPITVRQRLNRAR